MIAPPRNQPISVDDDIEWLQQQLNGLTRLGARAAASEAERYDFSIGWGTALAGRLRRLVHYSSLGQLGAADERRFRALCDELQSVSGLIDRLGLAQPVLDAGAQRQPRSARSA